MMDITTRHVTW